MSTETGILLCNIALCLLVPILALTAVVIVHLSYYAEPPPLDPRDPGQRWL